MRKILSIIAIAVLVIFNSCEKNEKPEFNDDNAFVAFNKAELSVNEDGTSLNIPVTLASISGKSATVSYTVIDGTAKQGVNFTLADASATLTFDAENRTQNIVINVINNPGVFTGDLKFSIQLSDEGTVRPNREWICSVVIADVDHPLAAMLGEWSAAGNSGFAGAAAISWDFTITKDEKDVNIVWFKPIAPSGAASPVYGVVNADKTKVKIPVYQITATSTSYPVIRLEGWYGTAGDDDIPNGGFVTFDIAAGMGSMTALDWYAVRAYNDAAASSSAGYYSIVRAGAVFTKK